ncbi:MAG: outer membrane beta-barrel protein [Weeksellaceae bacterium]|nr:outer membrane beta-barrel protein [Weeksellaceae bacterium]
MKKLLFTLTIILSATAFSQNIGDMAKEEGTEMAQGLVKDGAKEVVKGLANARFGLRAFGLINSSSLGSFSDVKDLKSSGFSVGIAGTIYFTDNFFVAPELHYSHTGVGELQLPILLGYSIIEDKLDIIAGPSLLYSFSKESKKDLEGLATGAASGGIDYKGLLSTFQVGYTAGLQYHLGNFMISGRYQGGFSGKIVDYVSQGSGVDFKESDEKRVKTSYVSLGVGYNF